jgi:hypothetical protein
MASIGVAVSQPWDRAAAQTPATIPQPIESAPESTGILVALISRGCTMARILLVGGLMVLVLGLAIQAVPYGRSHANPPVLAEPQWNAAETRTFVVRASFDCHSNETVWPWYSNVAPISWLVAHDVNDGRRALNFSEWTRPQKEAHEAARSVSKGEMPPRIYAIPRPAAQLSPSERQTLIEGLAATLGTKNEHRERER